MTQQEITVHNFAGECSGDVYDRTQTDDTIKDGDVLNLGNGNVAILVEAWPTTVTGEIKHFHRLEAGVTFETLDDGKYAPSAAKARDISKEIQMLVSLDGGQTFVPVTDGVRICYKNVNVPGEDEAGELHLNATTEGLISDLWVSREEHLDHNLGTSSEMVDDLIERLVDDPVSEH